MRVRVRVRVRVGGEGEGEGEGEGVGVNLSTILPVDEDSMVRQPASAVEHLPAPEACRRVVLAYVVPVGAKFGQDFVADL